MAIIIARPQPAPLVQNVTEAEDATHHDPEGDVKMAEPDSAGWPTLKAIVTPGEMITDDSQWMR